jgi:hypothetical protein
MSEERFCLWEATTVDAVRNGVTQIEAASQASKRLQIDALSRSCR